MSLRPTLAEIQAAAERIRPYARETPVLTCQTLNKLTGAELFFKCENFQRCGAFKFRGACNTIFSLTDEESQRGVVTHSSGNHAAAVSAAAAMRGIPAYIVMPNNSAPVKRAAVEGYGGQITFCEPTQAGREGTAAEIQARTGAALVHPYNDERIIAGQGTLALELLQQVPDLHMVLAPVGGGGLLSGILLAVKLTRPDVQVWAGEPATADDVYQTWKAGKLVTLPNFPTIADGLRTNLGDKTYPIVQKYIDGVARVSEDGIRSTLRLVLERMKIVAEPSAVVPLAALLEGQINVAGRKVGIVISGGNVELDAAPWRVPQAT